MSDEESKMVGRICYVNEEQEVLRRKKDCEKGKHTYLST